ncbi:SDR family NAD(P)-dependent oxidoreductase [Streptomyces durbertensis]|uniref:SDR family NAD(P)-dependent oxidoreductase n=1 Tax=Streptomyces durbertensis TaxID=2448886 RepID=A0ABR6EBM8_9ACTN|nr:SDR family NAD(P)-dependent oxidoreductase [Streptomyces durbertensis]MBB1242385.1 SDR family NAD(P)-dependent oxidoreductase [Streptomyces durbertensis]
MDAKDILTRFKDGTLDRADAARALLSDAAPAARAAEPGSRGTSESASDAGPAGAAPPEPVAIIGYSARFPGAGDADTFWRRVLDGDDLVTEVPAERWRVEEFYDPDPAAEGRSVSRWGAFLDDVDQFDADFFRMTPREAELTDPQARLFLQEAWRALEHAGQDTGALAGARCGVHAGVMLNDYQDLVERESPYARLPQVMQGNSNSMLAARVAYHLDLRGPAVTVDTACSSSLTALHLACQSLWLGEADLMVVGGVTLYLTELPHVYMSRAGMLSPRGRCRPFDASADGIVPGEGCAVVVLKPLSRALADGDPVHAVVRASGLNQDGRTNGITAPSARSQTALIRDTLTRFAVDPGSVDYVECHGTGTPLGDPIEVTALNDAFATAALPPGSLPIGSVKGNIGHTSAAAGLAGVLKAVGVVGTGEIPPSLHYERANPEIPFAEGPFAVAADRRKVASHGRPRRVCVSSFGFSGTNAHVVIEQAPAPSARPAGAEGGQVLVPLSGTRPRTPAAYAADLARWLRGPGSGSRLTDVAHTLAAARVHHPHRVALVVKDSGELLESLDLLAAGAADPRRVEADTTGRPDAAVRRAQAELLARLTEQLDGPPGEGELTALAQLYVQGHQVDWARIDRWSRPRRLSLPGYAFAPERHYVTAHVADGGRPGDPAADAVGGLVLYGREWTDAPLPSRLPSRDRLPDVAAPTLVHDPAGDLAAALAEAGSRVYRLRGDDVRESAEAVRDSGAAEVNVVVRLVGARRGDPAGTGADLDAFEAARAVLTAFRTHPVTLLVVTADPDRADAAGALVQTLRQENPRLSGRALLVDADLPDVERLLAEAAAPGPEWGHLADLRGPRRRRVLTPLAPLAAAEAPLSGGTGRVHLVTGGAGGVGLAVARHLLDRPGDRVVLCGRTPWAELGESARQAVTGHDRLRYVRADVTDPESVTALVAGVLDREGALHRVYHAAGVVRDAYLVRKRQEDVAEVIAPKAAGTVALDEATARLELEAFVLFSSVASVSGNLGQSDYAFANGVMDGLAVRRAERVARGERSGRTLCVQWPLWDVPGMTIPGPVLEVVERHTGMRPLPALLALAALDAMLEADGPIVVSLFHGDADVWRAHLAGLRLLADEPASRTPAPAPPVAASTPSHTATRPGSTPVSRDPGAGAAAPGGPGRADVAELVYRTVAEALGRPVSAVGGHTSVESLGLDSVMIRTVASRLSAEVAPVGPETLFGLRDLDALVEHLVANTPPAPAVEPGGFPAHPATSPPAARASAHQVPANRLPAEERSGTSNGSQDRYAIVGISGRYPQAPDLDAFWQNLLNGKDTVSDLPKDRWPNDAGVRAKGHFLTDVDAFDPVFFGLSTHDATLLDPQERLFLEVAWETLEHAGYTGTRLNSLVAADGEPRSVGVFAGITSGDYRLLGAERWAAGHRDMPSGHYWGPPNRLSYLLDLRGPSQPVDTACSSSLVALHLAIEAMRRGECAAALVGAVNLYVHPSRFRMLRQSGFLAEDGRCRSFGAGGAGFGPGEGAGAILLKPLDRAVADGDTVHAVVRGAAVAHGGRTNGFTAPSPTAQARVLRAALRESGTDPLTVNVIEAHGTGTELGDPVELAGLAAAYGADSEDAPSCSLGSVKSAVGHGESVAGLAALTKVVLQLRHGVLAPTLHADPVNPELRLESTRFAIQHAPAPWRPLTGRDGTPLPRRAGVSSFGAGGVNAHVLVEEFRRSSPAEPVEPVDPPGRPELVLLSAPSREHLRASAGRLASWLAGTEASRDLAATARSLRSGRAEMRCRLAVVARDVSELARALSEFADSAAETEVTGYGEVPENGGVHRTLGGAPETATFLADLWNNRRLHQLAELWLAGLDVLGAAPGEVGGTVPLPSSVFLRRRLWITDPPAGAGNAPIEPAVPAGPVEAAALAEPSPAPETAPERASEAAPPAPPAELARQLSLLVGGLVNESAGPVDPERELLELGIESINLMSLRFEINERFGRNLPLQLLSESSVNSLAAHLAADHAHA